MLLGRDGRCDWCVLGVGMMGQLMNLHPAPSCLDFIFHVQEWLSNPLRTYLEKTSKVPLEKPFSKGPFDKYSLETNFEVHLKKVYLEISFGKEISRKVTLERQLRKAFFTASIEVGIL